MIAPRLRHAALRALAVVAVSAPAAPTLIEQNERLLRELQRVHALSGAQMEAIRAIFARSGVIGQGNPAIAQHPLAPEQCRADLAQRSIRYDNPDFERICGAKSNMSAGCYPTGAGFCRQICRWKCGRSANANRHPDAGSNRKERARDGHARHSDAYRSNPGLGMHSVHSGLPATGRVRGLKAQTRLPSRAYRAYWIHSLFGGYRQLSRILTEIDTKHKSGL